MKEDDGWMFSWPAGKKECARECRVAAGEFYWFLLYGRLGNGTGATGAHTACDSGGEIDSSSHPD